MVTKIIGKENEDVPKVWNGLVIKTMTDYHNLYLKCDVSQLMCLSWDAMFDMTKAELDLISGAVMY